MPDGVLIEGGNVVATFEAKYSRRDLEWPDRAHVFQALSTAAAWDSPIAVLVYPEAFDATTWVVHGFSGKPIRMVAVGLGMYSYTSGVGDRQRAERLVAAVN